MAINPVSLLQVSVFQNATDEDLKKWSVASLVRDDDSPRKWELKQQVVWRSRFDDWILPKCPEQRSTRLVACCQIGSGRDGWRACTDPKSTWDGEHC